MVNKRLSDEAKALITQIAHAANHADPLAEALEATLEVCGKHKHTLPVDEFLAIDGGLEALHAYRSEL
jgi:hypothetical protein